MSNVIYILKGTTAGDGTVIGTCPASPVDLLCQPLGDCQVCNKLSDKYPGCNIKSATPVCDSDKDTDETQVDYSNPATDRECVKCVNSGKIEWEM